MSSWTHADVDRILAKQQQATAPKPSKYHNVKCQTPDGYTFDSKKEAAYWIGLQARQACGEIHSVQRQVPFALCCPDRVINDGSRLVVAEYVADFTFYDQLGRRHVIDVKSQATITKEYRLKRRWLELQDGIIVEEA